MIQFIAIPAYAGLNRFRGSSQTIVPKMAVCALTALGFAMVVPWAFSLPVLILTTMALMTGHGNFMDLGTWAWPSDPEKLEFLIAWMKPGYWHDFTGLAITGLVVTLPMGLVLLDWRIVLLGLLKGPCYALARVLNKTYPIELGEILTGAVYGLALAMAV